MSLPEFAWKREPTVVEDCQFEGTNFCDKIQTFTTRNLVQARQHVYIMSFCWLELNSASDIQESDKNFAYTANELFLANWKIFSYAPITCSVSDAKKDYVFVSRTGADKNK